MKILLIEWACSQPFQEGEGESPFFAEGKAMLMAVINDLVLHGHEIVTVVREELQVDDRSVQVHRPPVNKTLKLLLKSLALDCDAFLIIAPECRGILSEMVRAIEETGVRNIGCSSSAVSFCSDKFKLHMFWVANSVPTPETWLDTNDLSIDGPFIVKPFDGAGAEGIRLVKDFQCLRRVMTRCSLVKRGGFIIQRFVDGVPSSISCLVRPDGTTVYLPACGQIIGYQDGIVRYEGGWSPLSKELQIRCERLAMMALKGIKGILGWVGIDLILGESPDGSDDFVIEINPRLTTSYVGIRQMIAPSPVPWWINLEDRPFVLKDTWTKGLQWNRMGKVCGVGV